MILGLLGGIATGWMLTIGISAAFHGEWMLTIINLILATSTLINSIDLIHDSLR